MQLIRYLQGASTLIGLEEDGMVLPFSAFSLPLAGMDWRQAIGWLMVPGQRELARAEFRNRSAQHGLPADSIRFAIPALADSKILCVGLNYAAHAAEGGREVPEWPVFFTRYPSSFVGHRQELQHPFLSHRYDYEGELAVVIGQDLWRASESEAEAGIFGYTLGMDGSVRDYQKRSSQWTMGKNFDASGALGPGITPADQLPSAARGLTLTTTLNGEELQHGETNDLIFSIPRLISELSQAMTLQAGDIILTGTPEGVGFAREPHIWLKAGDELTIAVTGLPPLELTVAG